MNINNNLFERHAQVLFIRVSFGGAVLMFGGATVCRIRLPQPKRTTTSRQFFDRVSAMLKEPQRLRGKYIEFDKTSHCPPFKKLLKHDDQLSSKDKSTSSWTWTTSQRLENVFYRNVRH